MRLVDASIPYQIVYSLYHHEYLGFLISSHIVQLLPNKQLSLVHQGIYPDNMNQFQDGIDQKDEELIKRMAEISPKEVIKKFGGDNRKRVEFFTRKFEGQIKKLALDYIQRRLAKILPMLQDRSVFTMGKDGYAAHTPVKVLNENATVLFHFRRNENITRYFPTIKLRDQKIEFQYMKAAIICHEPAWMLLNNELFTFDGDLDGRKLQPFLNKRYIAIPKSKEQEYYEKFVTQIVEKYDVFAKGFTINTIRNRPQFSIIVNNHNESAFSFVKQVNYGRFSFPLKEISKVKAILEQNNGQFIFYRVERDQESETETLNFLNAIPPGKGSISQWEYVSKDQGLEWLSQYSDVMNEKGIKILQESDTYKLNLEKPELILSTEEAGDWFDIKAKVKIGEFEIPFIKFRTHILKGKREFVLPDKTIAILPEHWFSEFRHLLEVSEKKNSETLRIKNYQLPLLPAQLNNGLQSKWENLRANPDIKEATTPIDLKATLRNYQKEGFNWLYFMKEHKMGGILADDMGLGKTLQTLTLLQKELENGIETPSLIVLPTSLVHNWNNEASKFTPNLEVYIHSGVNRSKDVNSFVGKHLILTTYGIVRQDIDILKSFPFHYVILDESQIIKNPDSKTAKAIKQLVSAHRLSLTGTPIENTIMDIWSQMSFLNPGLLGNETFFKKFYVLPIEKDKDEKRSAKLRKIIYPFILRRHKQQVEKDLPPKIENLYYCEMKDQQKELYENTRNTYRNYLLDLINSGTWKKNKLNILTGLQKLRQIAIHPLMVEDDYDLSESGKYQEVKRLLNEVMQKNRKVLIFSQFVKMLKILEKDLKAEGLRYNYLDGNTRDRQAQVDSFQSDEDIRIFLISLKAGGVGLNLTAADYVFILDPWWNPAVESQAIDRSHRIGQKNTVFYYKFITRDSIEEKILKLQKRKSKLSKDIITVENDIYKSLNADDLGELFN